MTVTIPQERLLSLIRRHETVGAMLAAGHSGDDYVRLSREFAELDPVAEKARVLSDTESELADAEALIADPATDREMRTLAEDERRALAKVADAALQAAEDGFVHLVQRRNGPLDFSYLAVKTSRRAGAAPVMLPQLPAAA